MKGMESRTDEKERKAIEEGMKKTFKDRETARTAALEEYNTTLAKKQQNLQNAKTPDDQETCMSEVLYLNILKNRLDDPATLTTEVKLSEWDDAVLKEAQSTKKTFEKTEPEIKRTKTFQGKGIVLQDL